MNLAYRDVRHNLFRFLLTCFGLSLLLSVVLAMIGIYRGIVVDALTVARNHRVDLWVVEAGSRGPFAEASRIPGDSREAIARLAGVTEAGSVTYQSVEAEHLGRKIRLYVIGFEPGRPGGPDRIASGRMIAQSHFEMVADRGTGLSLGDRIKLGRTTFSVVGLTENQVASSGDPVAFITLLDAQKLQFDLAPPATRVQTARGTSGASKDTVNAVVARIAPEANADTVAEAARRWKHLSAMTQAEQESILTQSLVDRARRQIGMFTSILLLVSAVIIALIIYTMTMEKLRQIAMLKLIGAPDRTIVAMIVQQALALGLDRLHVRNAAHCQYQRFLPAAGRAGARQCAGARRGRLHRLHPGQRTWRASGAQGGPSNRSGGLSMDLAPRPEPLVSLRGISKHFGEGETRIDALRQVSIDVAPGEVVALRGPSGSGKTTLLNVIACILDPSEGTMSLEGEVVYDQRWLRHDLRRLRLDKIGFIFQSHNLLPFLNATDNVAIVLQLAGYDHSAARNRAIELLEYLEVGNRKNAFPAKLSGGEAQRVAIARALANRPRIILADEPTAALDSKRAQIVMDLLRKLAVDQSAAVIAVTHDEKIFDRFDRMFMLRDGRLEDERRMPTAA